MRGIKGAELNQLHIKNFHNCSWNWWKTPSIGASGFYFVLVLALNGRSQSNPNFFAHGNTTKIMKQWLSTRAEIPGSSLGSRGNVLQISQGCARQQDRRGSSLCSEEQIPRVFVIRRENLFAACACDCLKPPMPWIWTGPPKGERLRLSLPVPRGCCYSQHGFVTNPAPRAAAFAFLPLIIDGNLKISLSFHSSRAHCTLFSLLPSKSNSISWKEIKNW